MSNATKKLQILGTFGDDSDSDLPEVSAKDNGKMLIVENGVWKMVSSERFVKNALAITSFKATPSIAEIGSTVPSVKLDWTVNMTPASVTVNGTSVDPSLGTYNPPERNITTYKAWSLVVTDETGMTVTKPTSLTFCNRVYFGLVADGTAINEATIKALPNELRTDRKAKFSVTAKEGQRLTFATPSVGYGEPTFTIGKFDYKWTKVDTFKITNGSGYAENYDVWQHPQIIVGNVTVNVI